MTYQCIDCEKQVDEINTFAFNRVDNKSYYLCYFCVQKRMEVFDKIKESIELYKKEGFDYHYLAIKTLKAMESKDV